MGTPGTGDAAVTYTYLQHGREDETREDRCYEPEHLPTLLEDEENVSLADVLSLRDTCLTEEEVWAVFAECVRAVRSIGASHLFHTLCITPDTLAFNAHGNVCFMEQLSDDPEGSFVPPEFDMTGSTFEGHMYSLGCTLSAALDFVIEPELVPELGEEAMRLLELMQREKPEDRPLPQDVLSMAEERLSHTSSVSVCRKLSSLGRRVLSLESVAACQDGKEASWEARWQHPKTRCPLNRTSSPADGTGGDDLGTNNNTANGLSRQLMCGAWDSSLWAEDDAEEDSGEGGGDVVMALGDNELDYRSQSNSPVRRRAQQRLARARGVLNRSCSLPDSNNPPPALRPDISVHVTDLTEIGADERSATADAGKSAVAAWGESLRRFTRGVSCDSYDSGRTGGDCLSVLLDPAASWRGKEDTEESGCRARGAETRLCGEDSGGCQRESETRTCGEYSGECQRKSETRTCSESEERSASDSASPCTSCRERGVDHDCADDDDQEGSLSNSLCSLNNHMTKSMLCLNEESQDEWISLRELLVLSGRRLTVNELWALCYTCLATLQTYIDFPTYICLDTVHVGCEGEVLFLKPKNIGSRDAFYLAPEYQEHGILTEKACVYAVAAILWATAKFSLSPHQKLAMPRKLKRLLLEMAKRTPIERPSIVMAKKICGDYLSRQGTNAEAVWSKLINRVHQPLSRWTDVGEENGLDTERRPLGESAHINGGYKPMATESRLAPMPGPIPHSYAVREGLRLPEAFTSITTHFTPIILTNEEDSGEETPLSEAATEGAVHAFARSSDSQHMQVTGLDFTAHFEDPTTLTQPDTDSRAVRPDLPSHHHHHHHGAVSTTSTASSDRTLVNSPLTPTASVNSPLTPTASSNRTLVSSPLTPTASSDRRTLVNSPLTPTASSDSTLVNSPLTPTASSDRTLVNSPLTPTASSDSTLVNSPLTPTASSDRTLLNSPLTPTASSDRTLLNSPLTPTASSDRTLVNSPLTSPDEAKQGPRVSHPPLSSAPLNGCTLVNNYLLRQDPATGHLTLVPVQNPTAECIPGLELTLPLITSSVQRCCATHTGGNNGLSVDCVTVSLSPTAQQLLRSPPYFANGSSITHSREPEHAVHLTHDGGGDLREAGKDASPSELHRSNDVHPALQEVIDLLRGEFAFDGYLEDGAEDLAMGEYIFSLKDLQYQTFASVVKERFNGLYWEEDLLGVLHCLVNYSPSMLGSNEPPPSKGLQRAAATATTTTTTTTAPSTATIWTGGNKVHMHGCLLDLNGNVHVVVPGRPTADERARERRTEGQPGGKYEPYRCRNGEENQNHVCPGVRAASGELSGSGGVIMDRPAGGDDESPSEADDSLLATERGGPRRGGHNEGQMSSPDRSEDMEDSDSLVSERLLTSPGSRSPGESAMGFNGSSPRSWALAFYGEDCFSAEVIQYALNLGQHLETPCLDLKMQELQQQLTIETRNLRKTRNFYQKLIQQDRKNKGCESKLMSSKLKAQLEELISRVDFLESVKKYLEMLTVEQWGLDVSQLSSLAACGPGSLELPSSEEDPAVLSFGTHKGKRTLQAGSPLGLMAYLYARNAAVEGYVQHFLYTYRHFCTPEELLQFLMDRFISSSRAGPELSGDDAKVFHRSLALLEAWVMDCRLVDFTQTSGLLTTLENFLISQVAPLDSRGGVLLTSLHSSPSKTWRSHHGGESLISPDEADDSLSVQLLCGKSSVEDLGRKTFQWKISRVVEPKEKAFSVAAFLPVPAYGSLADDHLTSGWRHRADERRPFGQSDYSSQRTAQQLTLLQQDVFHGCHPVHFLNSRTQGVKEKVLSLNKNVSQQHVSPPEGNNLPVCEGTQRGDSHLQRLLTYADSVTNWISAEIVICDTLKTQVALLSKFLLIGKHCYEWRNFATAMQILRGLENVIVRQLPAWKHLPSKVCEILEELRAVQVFLKSDDLCLMGGEQARRRPTLPSAHILAMHIQQLEIGAYTLTTGAYKWTKLRSIAKVVSQVHAFQVAAYPYSPDGELQAYLRHRIASLSARDVHLLAADNDANFQQPTTERHARRIQDTLRRVKATFQ